MHLFELHNKFNKSKLERYKFKKPKKELSEYNKTQMRMGVKVEKEHINDEDIAAIIAAHHLDELPDYYTRLKRVEKH